MAESAGKKNPRSNLLDGILSDHNELHREMNSNTSSEKRQRLDGGRDMFSTIYGILHETHSKVKDQGIDSSKLEVEARIGMIISCDRRWRSLITRPEVIPVEDRIRSSCNLTFLPGIDDIQIERLKMFLYQKDLQQK